MLSELPRPKREITRAVMILLGFTLVLMVFGPAVWTLFWHVRHGSSIVYKGQTIRIPLEWTANTGGTDMQFTKCARTVFSEPVIVGWIFFSPSLFPANMSHDEVAKSWEAHYWNGAAVTDDIVSGPLNVGSGANKTLCMESFPKRIPESASANCFIFQSSLQVTFSGERKDLDTFLKIVHEMN
jgi:hypothetical protein